MLFSPPTQCMYIKESRRREPVSTDTSGLQRSILIRYRIDCSFWRQDHRWIQRHSAPHFTVWVRATSTYVGPSNPMYFNLPLSTLDSCSFTTTSTAALDICNLYHQESNSIQMLLSVSLQAYRLMFDLPFQSKSEWNGLPMDETRSFSNTSAIAI